MRIARHGFKSLHEAIVAWLAAGENVVLACSALKAAYRDQLLVSPDVKLVYLRGSMELIRGSTGFATGHYMDPHLLRSQFETLEEPKDASDHRREPSHPRRS